MESLYNHPTQQTQASWWVEPPTSKMGGRYEPHIPIYESVIASLFQSSLAENDEQFQERYLFPQDLLLCMDPMGSITTI